MAAGRHRSRFRCLTLARIFASVVAIGFAATVVVVVLTAGLSPDNVRVSITHGHIQSARIMWSSVNYRIEHLRRPRIDTITFYTPATDLTVWVSMDAHDPTGRASSVCVTSIHVLDMPHAPSFEGMVDIATMSTLATGNASKPCARWRHRNSTTMQLDRWVTLKDPLMLCYISQKYGGRYDFTVMLKVDMRIVYPEEDEDRDTPAETYTTHYCWPVTLGNSRRISSGDVTCRPNHAFEYASIAPVLSLRDHLTPSQQRICSTWGQVNLTRIFSA